jgi:AraC-like DNA-binding protein
MERHASRCTGGPIPASHRGEHVLGSLAAGSIWLTYEARAPRFQGPRQARHPDDLELSVIQHGVGYVRLDRRELQVCEGHYCVIGPGIEHSSWSAAAAVVELNIHLRRDLLERAAAELGIDAGEGRWPREAFASPPDLGGVVEALRAGALAGDSAPLMTEALGLYLCGFLLRRHLGAAAVPAFRARGLERDLQRSVELMNAAHAEPLSLDALARAAGMGRFRYVHAFKRRFGLPPYAYLTRLRVDLACERMLRTDLPLTTIALDAGFPSASRFSESFRRVHGTTPTRWRAQRRPGR